MGGEYLGMGVVAVIGTGRFTGHQLQGVFLAEYDEVTDSYTGISFPKNEFFTQLLTNQGKGEFAPGAIVNVGVAVRIPGLRRYPYAERPDYAFQFVLPGEDPAPLRAIMAGNASTATTADLVEEPAAEPQTAPAQDNRPTWQKLGFTSKEEWRQAGKPEA